MFVFHLWSLLRILNAVTDPSGIRVSVTGNILGIQNPRSAWNKHFGTTLVRKMVLFFFSPQLIMTLKESPILPVPLGSETLSDVGKQPAKKVVTYWID